MSQTTISQAPDGKANTKNIVIAVLAVLAIGLIGALVYTMLSNQETNEDLDTEQTENTQTDEEENTDSTDDTQQNTTEEQNETEEPGSEQEISEEDEEAAEGETVQLYFYKEPLEPQHNVEDISSVERQTESENLYTYVLTQLIQGPSAEEKQGGYISVFSLSGSSTCSGHSFQYKTTGSTLKVQICKEIEPVLDAEGAYAGITLNAQARVIKQFNKSLSFGGIESVALFDKNGNCYAPESGQNACDPDETY
jgi:hypothetical protein